MATAAIVNELDEQREIIRHLIPKFVQLLHPSEVIDFIPSLNELDAEAIREKERYDRIGAARQLMSIITETEDDGILNEFIYSLEENWYKVFVQPIFGMKSSVNEEYKEYCEFIFKRIRGELIRVVNPFEILQDLSSRECLNNEDIENIKAFEGPKSACREMFSRLQSRREDWILQLLEVLGQNGYGHVITKADPSATPEECISKNVVFSQDENAANESSHSTEVKVIDDNRRANNNASLQFDFQACFGLGDIENRSGNILPNLNTDENRQCVPVNEEYQDSDDGDSDYEKSEREGNCKIVFMARTTELVKQQYKLFHTFLPKNKLNYIVACSTSSIKPEMVCLISREDECCTKLNLVILDYDVFFMTPQILLNNLREEHVKISMFSLFIIDECHHTDKNEPYNGIMRIYIKEKKRKPNTERPKIVGLTATIGVGTASTDDDAVEHMLKICANLDVDNITTVEDNIEEMRKYTTRPKTEQLKMEDRVYDPCRTTIIETMKKVEEVIDRSLNGVPELKQNLNERPLNDYRSKNYQQWLVTTRDKTACILIDKKIACREIVSSLQHLFMYNEALEINYLMNEKFALKYLSDRFEGETSNESCLIEHERRLLSLFRDLQHKLKELCRNPVVSNPNLDTLVGILRKSFDDSGSMSRGIVFVQTRARAFALSQYLDYTMKSGGIRCRAFTGSKTTESADGMKETDKKVLLENFKSGEIKLLVSTSVGAEGIDIPECNIVITYNYSGNEVHVIQMRGRLRKEGGTAIRFGDHRTQLRDTISVEKAAMMYRALEKLIRLQPEVRRMRIAKLQEQNMMTEEIRQRQTDMQDAQKPKVNFKIKCYRCKKVATDSNSLRIYNNNFHVVTDPNFLKFIKKKPLKKQDKFDNMIKLSRMFCQNCPLEWGKIFSVENQEVPVIRIEAFVCECVLHPRDQRFKRWNEFPYCIEKIEKEELLQLLMDID